MYSLAAMVCVVLPAQPRVRVKNELGLFGFENYTRLTELSALLLLIMCWNLVSFRVSNEAKHRPPLYSKT